MIDRDIAGTGRSELSKPRSDHRAHSWPDDPGIWPILRGRSSPGARTAGWREHDTKDQPRMPLGGGPERARLTVAPAEEGLQATAITGRRQGAGGRGR